MPLPDQADRDRFCREIGTNFSVIAPAGVGKTSSLSARVATLATEGTSHEAARERLRRLVVVTYTNRAAEEMLQRARLALVGSGAAPSRIEALNEAFFGTIHAFCVRLLRQHGYRLGVPASLELLGNDDDLWPDFVAAVPWTEVLPDAALRESLLRQIPFRDLLALSRQAGIRDTAPAPAGPLPLPDLTPLREVKSTAKSAANLQRSLAAAETWAAALRNHEPFVVAPEPFGTAGALVAAWQTVFGPWRRHLAAQAGAAAARVAEAYRTFRLRRGTILYEDQISLAADLVRHPEAAAVIRAEERIIILDEAQDTDREQFRVLLEAARPADATGTWLADGGAGPAPGRFSMVGDPQQSIYGDRADPAFYLDVHHRLTSQPGASALTFSVTFRCDAAVIGFVNARGPALLNGEDGQAAFVPLTPGPRARSGQVLHIPIEPGDDGKESVRRLRRRVSAQVAAWIRQQGLAGLRARSWREVAVLCPRVDWLGTLHRALAAEGLSSGLQSTRAAVADHPASAWLVALLWVLTHPQDAFEVTGVLREVFGISDDDIGHQAQGRSERLHLDDTVTRPGTVGTALNTLSALRSRVAKLPVSDAVRTILSDTQLRDRLASLPADIQEGTEAELEGWLARSVEAESQRQTLTEFAESARHTLAQRRDAAPPTGDNIVLISCHKAKGLEWDAVIVPLIGHDIGEGPSTHPRVVPRGLEPPEIILQSTDQEASTKERRRQRHAAGLQRLLYVTLTRARHTLALTQDAHLFLTKSGLSGRCFGRQLAEDHAALTTLLDGLPETGTPDPVPAPAATPRPPSAPVVPWCAPAAGASFETPPLQRFLPHQLKGASEPEPPRDVDHDPDAPRSTGAVDYGLWWHRLMELLPLPGDDDAWNQWFAASLDLSPDRERSEREWALFLASPTARRLRAWRGVLHREMPVLWRRDAATCIEGVIDLAHYSDTDDRWEVLDWKTNRIGPDGVAAATAEYTLQLQAYAGTLKGVSGRAAGASLYFTALGTEVRIA